MGIRRRRKKVNTILSTIDRRLRTVELQRVPRVVKDGTITKKMLSKEVTLALDSAEDGATDNPGITTPQPPTFRTKPFTNIVKIVYRGYNETGTANDRDRARVYFEADPGLNVGDKFRFAAVTGSLDIPSKTKEYTVREVATVDGYSTIVYAPGRSTILNGTKTYDKGWRIRASNVSVTGAIVEGSTTKYKYGQIIVFDKDATPASNSDYLRGPTWPAGIETTAGTHFTGGGFAVGSLINIDGLGSLFDGTHKVTYYAKVGSQITIQFEFKEYPTAPVQLPNSNGAIRGAAGRYLRDGETWTDTNVDPPVTWIWDEQRQLWWNSATADLPDGVIVDDGIPPSPPTNLSGTSEGYVVGSRALSRVNLSWTAPTTNSNGTNLSDLKGYAVYYRYSTSDPFTFYSDTASNSEVVSELTPERTVFFAVKAYDVTRNMSEFSASYSINTVPGTLGLNAPSLPVTTSRLGQIRVTWDGLDSSGATPPLQLISHLEVHWSTTDGFTPSDSTNKGRIFSKNDFFADIDPVYGTPYYFKFVFVDIFGKKSAASAQKSETVKPLVDTDLIEGSLTRWPFGDNTIDVDSLANGSIAATYLVSGSDANGNAVRLEGKIAAGSIGAIAIAANSIVAGKIAAEAITAREIKALSIEAGNIKANAITTDKIEAGAVTGDKILATTRIRLANSTGQNPTSYIEFGHTAFPGTNSQAPGIIAQYGGARSFYMGGWNGGQGTSGFSLGLFYNNAQSQYSVLTTDGYDNGLFLSPAVNLRGGSLGLRATGGNASDGYSLGPVEISTQQGPIILNPSGGSDLNGQNYGVYIPTNRPLMIAKTTVNNWQTIDGTHINNGLVASTNTGGAAGAFSRKGSNGAAISFFRESTNIVGTISVTSTATAYNTSSDYRLKENVTPISSAIEKLRLLKPRTFNFKSEPKELVDGFIAHELQEVLPIAVTGAKDEEDSEGNPVYQGVDASKVVPLLTAALQESITRIEALESRLES